jgi:sulfide:quinone oxidoreductase
MIANKMAKKLDLNQWKIILVDKDKDHYYQPGFLFVPFGIYRPEDVLQPKTKHINRKVEFILSDIEKIIPQENKVILTEGKQEINYDVLVVATGSTIRPEETEGLLGDGWRKNIFDFYTYDGAVALSQFLKSWKGGRLVINIAEMPIKCPVAPLEFTFLADWYFAHKGLRDKVEIIYSTPLPGVFTKPKSSAVLGDLLKKKNVHVEPDFAISEVDSIKNTIRSFDGREIPYDLLITIPVNMGSEIIERSGFGDDLHFIPTDKYTLQSLKWQNMWVIGDAANIPASKAGAVTHFEMEPVVENILAQIQGKPLPGKFDGHANCYIETGYNKAALIDFSYDVEPLPGTYPLPIVGPFKLLGESWINHMGKLFFRWMYWNLLLPGRPMPVSNEMSMVGKRK